MKEDMIRLYQFMPDQYGLQNILNRRLKVSFPDQVNDLFEMMPFDFGQGTEAELLRKIWKDDIRRNAKRVGFISFSEKWDVPTMWAHYAADHRGVCLGFDLAKGSRGQTMIDQVSYKDSLRTMDLRKLKEDEIYREEIFSYAQKTKSRHWEYEHEWRLYCRLTQDEQLEKNKDPNKSFFLDFNDKLRLREVILGHRSTLTSQGLKRLLEPKDRVSLKKAQPSFRKFAMVQAKLTDVT